MPGETGRPLPPRGTGAMENLTRADGATKFYRIVGGCGTRIIRSLSVERLAFTHEGCEALRLGLADGPASNDRPVRCRESCLTFG
jgi:hypothetical protein